MVRCQSLILITPGARHWNLQKKGICSTNSATRYCGYWIFASMSNYTALLDANVLYPAPPRDLLMQLVLDIVLFRHSIEWNAAAAGMA